MLRKLTHPGTLILIGFACMIIFVMAIFLSVDTDAFQLVTDNYYDKELDYQSQLDAESRAKKLGSEFQLYMSKDTLHYALPASMYADVDSVHLFFYHVSESKLDREYTLPTENTQYHSVPCKFTHGKNYELSFSFTADGKEYLRKIKTR